MEKQINIVRNGDVTPITYVDPGQVREIEKHGNKFHEYTMLEAIAALQLKGTYIDIGAHVGNHTIFFAKYCPCDKIVCFEPDSCTWACLNSNLQNVGVDKMVIPIKAAVGNFTGTSVFKANVERPGQSRVVEKGEGCLINITTLPEILEDISLIKIDVEGDELKVIEGCLDAINKQRPELFIETFGPPIEVLRKLPKGYRVIKRYNNAPTYHFSCK